LTELTKQAAFRVPKMSDSEVPQIFLLVENPSKNNNLGPLLRCASAFGIRTIVAVGFDKCAVQGAFSKTDGLIIPILSIFVVEMSD
jgi:tRNA G18 (ribose-2'-O)-methylase SpoU